jgi:hypothetical protein
MKEKIYIHLTVGKKKNQILSLINQAMLHNVSKFLSINETKTTALCPCPCP